MAARLTVWIVAALAVAIALSVFVPAVGGVVLVLAVPAAVVASIRARWRAAGDTGRDAADRLVAAAATLTEERTSPTGEQQPGWGPALRAELATITPRRERRRFALGAAFALLGRPQWHRSLLVAAAVAVALGAALLGVSRAGLGDDGLGSVTTLVPPVVLGTTAYLCSRSTRSLRFGLETGIAAALATLVAVAVVYGVEAAHWYHLRPGVSVLDGERIDAGSAWAAVLDAAHPVILAVHLVFWAPWPVLGAVIGARGRSATTG